MVNIFKLSSDMLNLVMLSVIMLSVMAPTYYYLNLNVFCP